MGNATEWLAAIVALVALGVSLQTSRRQRVLQEESYLILSLTLETKGHHLIASTSLENRSPRVKNLDVVFLLVGPCDESPTETFNAILRAHGNGEVADVKEFGSATSGTSAELSEDDRQYIRLEYYTLENSEVADEILTYEAVLDTSALRSGCPYSVRLFLYGRNRLHRVVQRAVVG